MYMTRIKCLDSGSGLDQHGYSNHWWVNQWLEDLTCNMFSAFQMLALDSQTENSFSMYDIDILFLKNSSCLFPYHTLFNVPLSMKSALLRQLLPPKSHLLQSYSYLWNEKPAFYHPSLIQFSDSIFWFNLSLGNMTDPHPSHKNKTEGENINIH